MCSREVFVVCIGVVLLAEIKVHAYADPGSGTLIWQILMAASLGAMFYLRRIIVWARGLKKGKEVVPADQDVRVEAAKREQSL